MNTLDIIILIPIVWGIYKGFKNGLISEFAQFAGLVLGLLLAFRLSNVIALFLISEFKLSESFSNILGFALTFLAVLIGVYFLARILEKLVKAIALAWLNIIGGIIVGGLKFTLIIGIILSFIINLDKNENFISAKTKESSILLKPTTNISNFFTPHIKNAISFTEQELGNKEKITP